VATLQEKPVKPADFDAACQLPPWRPISQFFKGERLHMFSRIFLRVIPGAAIALAAVLMSGLIATAQSPLAIDTARVTIAGTSNVHDYTATTSDARITRVELGESAPGPAFWEEVQKPGGLKAFDITIAAATLRSPKEGLDKNMYKALKVKDHPEITFRLSKMGGAPGALLASGTLQIAGVEREVTLPLKTSVSGGKLSVSGALDVMMTDYGISPPKALMGMVKADPKITVTFDVVLAITTT
jgi:YceI-like domain